MESHPKSAIAENNLQNTFYQQKKVTSGHRKIT